MNEEVLLLSTAPAADAPTIARRLVERRLAACVNILPGVQSIYQWRGQVEEAQESLLLIKTGHEQTAAIDEALRELHPYEVYELLQLAIEGGNAAYLRWLHEGLQNG